MCQHATTGRIPSQGLEICVMFAGTGYLEETGTNAEAWHCGEAGWEVAELGAGGCVVSHAEAVDVKEAVALLDLVLSGRLGMNLGVMAEEEGKVVIVYLFGDGVLGSWDGC